MALHAARPEQGPRISFHVGQRIRAARQEQGLTLAQLGGEDLTRGFLSAVELGRSDISLKALWIVATRLGKPMSYFLDGSDAAIAAIALPELILDEAERALHTKRPTEALALVDEAGEIAELQSRSGWLRGWALIDLGRAREAIPILEAAVALTEAGDDPRHAVLVRYTLMSALFASGNFDEALGQLRRAYEQANTQLDDHALMGKITVALGHIYYAQGNLESALSHYGRARELFDTVNDLDNLAAVYTGLSRIHRQKGDLKAALRYSRLSLGIFEAKHNEWAVAHELNNMAARYDEMGDTDQALALAHEAVERAHRTGAPDVESLSRSMLAAVYLHLGNVMEAQAQAEAAHQLGGDDTDFGSIDSLVVLARVADQLGQAERADALYRRALTALERTGFQTRYADVALAYSETLRVRNDMQGALEFAVAAAKALAVRSS